MPENDISTPPISTTPPHEEMSGIAGALSNESGKRVVALMGLSVVLLWAALGVVDGATLWGIKYSVNQGFFSTLQTMATSILGAALGVGVGTAANKLSTSSGTQEPKGGIAAVVATDYGMRMIAGIAIYLILLWSILGVIGNISFMGIRYELNQGFFSTLQTIVISILGAALSIRPGTAKKGPN